MVGTKTSDQLRRLPESADPYEDQDLTIESNTQYDFGIGYHIAGRRFYIALNPQHYENRARQPNGFANPRDVAFSELRAVVGEGRNGELRPILPTEKDMIKRLVVAKLATDSRFDRDIRQSAPEILEFLGIECESRK